MRHARVRDVSLVGCQIGSYTSEAGRYREEKISIDAYGAKFDGRFVMAISGSDFPTVADGVVVLSKATVGEIVNLRGAHMLGEARKSGGGSSEPAHCGVSLDAGGLRAKGLFMGRRFYSAGTTYAHACRIDGPISADGGRFGGPLPAEMSEPRPDPFDEPPPFAVRQQVILCLRYAEVGGMLQLGSDFCAYGTVDLHQAHVKGPVDLWAGRFVNPYGVAVLADDLKVDGDLVCTLPPDPRTPGYARMTPDNRVGDLRGGPPTPGYVPTVILGEASFANATIKGEADFARAILRAPMPRLPDGTVSMDPATRAWDSSHIALSFFRATIGGRLRLGRGFRTSGLVALEEAHIGGTLDLQGGWFVNPDAIALAANRATIEGDVIVPRKWLGADLHSSVGQQDTPLPHLRNKPDSAPHNAIPNMTAEEVAEELLTGWEGSDEQRVRLHDELPEAIALFCDMHRHSVERRTIRLGPRVRRHLGKLVRRALRRLMRPAPLPPSPDDIADLLIKRFVAIGLVSFKGARIGGDMDAAGGLFFGRRPSDSPPAPKPPDRCLRPELYEAVSNRVTGYLSRWTALDLSYATIQRSLFLTRWVPRRSPTPELAPRPRGAADFMARRWKALRAQGATVLKRYSTSPRESARVWAWRLRPSGKMDQALFATAVVGVLDLTATDVDQLHITPKQFTPPRRRSRSSALLIERLTYREVHPHVEELAHAKWFVSGYPGSTSQPNEQLSGALRRQGLHTLALRALLHRPQDTRPPGLRHTLYGAVRFLESLPRRSLLGIVYVSFPWIKSLAGLAALWIAGTVVAVRSHCAVRIPLVDGDWIHAARLSWGATIPGVAIPKTWEVCEPELGGLLLALGIGGALLTFTFAVGVAGTFRRP